MIVGIDKIKDMEFSFKSLKEVADLIQFIV